MKEQKEWTPHLTMEELELCRIFGVKYLSRNTGEHYVKMWDNKPRLLEVFMNKLYIEHGSGARHIGTLDSSFFPSFDGDGCICVEEGE